MCCSRPVLYSSELFYNWQVLYFSSIVMLFLTCPKLSLNDSAVLDLSCTFLRNWSAFDLSCTFLKKWWCTQLVLYFSQKCAVLYLSCTFLRIVLKSTGTIFFLNPFAVLDLSCTFLNNCAVLDLPCTSFNNCVVLNLYSSTYSFHNDCTVIVQKCMSSQVIQLGPLLLNVLIRENVEGQQFTWGVENTNMTDCISSL